MVAETGRIDIAFCNAGIREIVPAQELLLTEWRKVIDVCREKKFRVILDSAYQGYASGSPEKDREAIEMFMDPSTGKLFTVVGGFFG